MKKQIEIEEALHDVYQQTDLLKFEAKLAIEKQLTRLVHFDVVTDDELMSYGLSAPAVRRLRAALKDYKKKVGKSNKIFTLGKKTGNRSRLVIAQFEPEETHQNGVETTSTPSMPCLIGRDEIKLMETLGEGTFAVVKRAIWNKPSGQKIDCAVKILREISEEMKADLHAEIMNMQKLRHNNLIQLHGIVYGEPTLMVIEFCDGGALLDRLRNQDKPVLLVTRLLNYAQQIASGMAYLESRRCVHRDLAARNVLLAENEEVVKICDFGMTRHLNENERLYVMSGMKKVPFSWCPPESLSRRQFSHQSDVWAFGVLLWELYTYGEEPWAGYRAADVLRMTEGGERLRTPEKASKELYDLMMMCWQLQPENRPKFSLLRQLLKEIRFMIAECRSDHPAETSSELSLMAGDKVVIINENDQRNWYGQSMSSGLFGAFSRSVVAVKTSRQPTVNSASSNLSPTKDSSYISRPVPGSLIHTGHGDIDEKNCWGYVEKIDPIYLQNPILRPSNANSSPRAPVNFIPSAAALDETPRILPSSSSKEHPNLNAFATRNSPPRPPKKEDKPPLIPATNFTHQFESDFKPRSYSHDAKPARSSSAIPFQTSASQQVPVVPPKQRISPPPKPTRRPVSITPEMQAKAAIEPPKNAPEPLKPTIVPPKANSTASTPSDSSFNNVNFRPMVIPPPAQESRRRTVVPTLPEPIKTDENRRNSHVNVSKPSLDQLQKQKDAFNWINLETIASAREKILKSSAETHSSSNTLPKTSSTSVLTPVPAMIVPKKQTTPPPILAENFINANLIAASSSGSTNSMPSMGISLANGLNSSNTSINMTLGQAKIPILTSSVVPRPTPSTAMAQGSTNSAPSTLRAAFSQSATTSSAPSSVRVHMEHDRIPMPEKARPQVSNIFPPTKTTTNKPIANISPMPPAVPSTSASIPAGPDPFMISEDVKTIAAKARYSQVHTKMPNGILAGGSLLSSLTSSSGYGTTPNGFSTSDSKYNTMAYSQMKPTTGIYSTGFNSVTSNYDSLGLTSGISSHSSMSSASSLPPSSDELLNSLLKTPVGTISNGSSNSAPKTNETSINMNVPPSSDELFPEIKTSSTSAVKVDTSRPDNLPLSALVGNLLNSGNKVGNPTATMNQATRTPTMTTVSSALSMSNVLASSLNPSIASTSTMNRPSATQNLSWLPPPSPLLLSGNSTSSTNPLPSSQPSSMLIPQSVSVNLTPSYAMSRQALPLQTAPLYVAGNSSNVGFNNFYNTSPQFSTWNGGQINSYMPSGYPGAMTLQPTRVTEPQVLQPIPAMPLPSSGSNTPISLDFLDVAVSANTSNPINDESIAKVRSLFDGASVDKCRQYLRKFNGNIARTVKELKIDQLIEIGIAGDRALAMSALDSCQWDVNAAAERLLTS